MQPSKLTLWNGNQRWVDRSSDGLGFSYLLLRIMKISKYNSLLWAKGDITRFLKHTGNGSMHP